MTNGDKIRCMSNIELANLFTKLVCGNKGEQLDGIWQEKCMEESRRYFMTLNWCDWLNKEIDK